MKGKDRNKVLCECGNGKKYKNCCAIKDWKNGLADKGTKNNEFGFFARIISQNGSSGGIEISNVKTNQKTLLENDKVILKTNLIEESNNGPIGESTAILILPSDGSNGIIKTHGNASIKNKSEFYQIKLLKPRIKVIGSKQLYATITIDESKRYFDGDLLNIIGGLKENGGNHFHITFTFDGNGNYIGFRNYNCVLRNELFYNKDDKTIIPNKIQIDINDYSNALSLDFKINKDSRVIELVNATFIDITCVSHQ